MGNRDVMRLVPTCRRRSSASQILEQQQPWVETSSEERAHLPQRRGQPVAFLEREGAADDRRLLTAPVIKVADHLALLEQVFESLLEPTAQNEIPVQSSQLFTRQ